LAHYVTFALDTTKLGTQPPPSLFLLAPSRQQNHLVVGKPHELDAELQQRDLASSAQTSLRQLSVELDAELRQRDL
jgi:hypothetical protein